MYNKDSLSVLLIIVLLSIILFSPQITNLFEGMTAITGADVSDTAVMNVTLASTAPTIPSVNVSVFSPATPTVTLDDKTVVSFTFVVSDIDGVAGLQGFANLTGANDGTTNYQENNLTCLATAWLNLTAKQFNCSFDMWYWYKSGMWNVSINATDGANWAHNNGSNFNYGSTTGMTMSPTTLGWTGLAIGDTNKTTTNDPLVLNNTGNYNVSLSKVNVTAYDLHGETNTTEEIGSGNFTVDRDTGGVCTGADCTECDGTIMVNTTSTDITNSMLPRGNNSVNDGLTGQEQLYACLTKVPSGISVQSYSTANSQQWIVGVS